MGPPFWFLGPTAHGALWFQIPRQAGWQTFPCFRVFVFLFFGFWVVRCSPVAIHFVVWVFFFFFGIIVVWCISDEELGVCWFLSLAFGLAVFGFSFWVV